MVSLILTKQAYSNGKRFQRSLPSLNITLRPSSVWESNALLNRAAKTRVSTMFSLERTQQRCQDKPLAVYVQIYIYNCMLRTSQVGIRRHTSITTGPFQEKSWLMKRSKENIFTSWYYCGQRLYNTNTTLSVFIII